MGGYCILFTDKFLADGLGVGRGSQDAGGFLGIARMDFDHTGDRGKPAGL